MTYNQTEDRRVIIEDFEDKFGDITYSLYDSAGHMIEADFDSYEDAEEWAEDNDYIVVETFNEDL